MKSLSNYTLKEIIENLDAFCDGKDLSLKDCRVEIYPFIEVDGNDVSTEAIPYNVVFYNMETGEEFQFSEFLETFDQQISEFLEKNKGN